MTQVWDNARCNGNGIGITYELRLQFAPYSKVPRKKAPDTKVNTIAEGGGVVALDRALRVRVDPEYLEFLESLSAPRRQRPSAESVLLVQEQAAGDGNEIMSSALLEALNQKARERMAKKVRRREEGRRGAVDVVQRERKQKSKLRPTLSSVQEEDEARDRHHGKGLSSKPILTPRPQQLLKPKREFPRRDGEGDDGRPGSARRPQSARGHGDGPEDRDQARPPHVRPEGPRSHESPRRDDGPRPQSGSRMFHDAPRPGHVEQQGGGEAFGEEHERDGERGVGGRGGRGGGRGRSGRAEGRAEGGAKKLFSNALGHAGVRGGRGGRGPRGREGRVPASEGET